jgi:transposase
MTLDAMLDALEARSAKREGVTVVMDRGIASAENVGRLTERGYHYIVGVASQSRHSWVEEIRSAEFHSIDPAHPEIGLWRTEREREVFLVVRSATRIEKDRAIRERFMTALQGELSKLASQVAAGKVSREKAQVRIGRLRQRYQRASRFMTTEFVEEDGSVRLEVGIDEEKLSDAHLLDGVYILRTDRRDLEMHQLWQLYMMLQHVERSFRYLKTSLGIRPTFHQIERRTDGHIFISILAYHLLHTIEQLCQAAGDHRSWPTLNEELETHRALTIEMDDSQGRRHHLRLATTPTQTQKQIYRMLDLTDKPLPTRRYVVDLESSDENEGAVVTP